MYKIIDISEIQNNIGITELEYREKGNFTVSKSSLPMNRKYVNKTLHINEIPFIIKKKNRNGLFR